MKTKSLVINCRIEALNETPNLTDWNRNPDPDWHVI